MIRYTTVAKEAHVEQVIERSRFIGHICHIESKEEFEAFREKIRAQWPGADHNVPAYILGEKMEIMWNSDRGEPAGTAGPPIMQFLQKEGLTNVCCIVTRYFGGILLGKGGLVRAYTSSAKLALEEAGKIFVKDIIEFRIRLPYNSLGKLQNLENDLPFELKNVTYSDKVDLSVIYEPEYADAVEGMLRDLCGGEPETVYKENKLNL